MTWSRAIGLGGIAVTLMLGAAGCRKDASQGSKAGEYLCGRAYGLLGKYGQRMRSVNQAREDAEARVRGERQTEIDAKIAAIDSLQTQLDRARSSDRDLRSQLTADLSLARDQLYILRSQLDTAIREAGDSAESLAFADGRERFVGSCKSLAWAAINDCVRRYEYASSYESGDGLLDCVTTAPEAGAALNKVPTPFVNTMFFSLVLGVIVVGGIAGGVAMKQSWTKEVDRVRAAVAQRLGVAPSNHPKAREQILALVPCHAIALSGPLAPLGSSGRIWLCFLSDGLLAVSGAADRRPVALSPKDLRKLYLMKEHKGNAAIAIELDGGTSQLSVDRLDDMVRIVNLLVKQGITIRYLRSGGNA